MTTKVPPVEMNTFSCLKTDFDSFLAPFSTSAGCGMKMETGIASSNGGEMDYTTGLQLDPDKLFYEIYKQVSTDPLIKFNFHLLLCHLWKLVGTTEPKKHGFVWKTLVHWLHHLICVEYSKHKPVVLSTHSSSSMPDLFGRLNDGIPSCLMAKSIIETESLGTNVRQTADKAVQTDAEESSPVQIENPTLCPIPLPLPPPPPPILIGVSGTTPNKPSPPTGSPTNYQSPSSYPCASCDVHSKTDSHTQEPCQRSKFKPFRWNKILKVHTSSVWNERSNGLRRGLESTQKVTFIDWSQLEKLFSIKESENNNMHFKNQSVSDSLSPIGMFRAVVPDLECSIVERRGSGSQVLVRPSRRSCSTGRRLSMVQRSVEPQILDGKRCMNINIHLSQYRSESVDLLDVITREDIDSIGAERLRGLMKLLPNDNEEKALINLCGPTDQMDPAEQFLLRLVQIPDYSVRLENMLFRAEFHVTVNWIRPTLRKLTKTMEDIFNSVRLKRILHIILEVGNFINNNGRLGSAQAFKVDSLLKLTEFRAIQSRISLLHFLVQQFSLYQPDLLKVQQELPHIRESTDICLDSITNELQRLHSGLHKMQIHAKNDHAIRRADVEQFIENAHSELCGLDIDSARAMDYREKCATYFSESLKDFNLNDCLQTLSSFLERMKMAEKEIKELGITQSCLTTKHIETDIKVQTDRTIRHNPSPIRRRRSIAFESSAMLNDLEQLFPGSTNGKTDDCSIKSSAVVNGQRDQDQYKIIQTTTDCGPQNMEQALFKPDLLPICNTGSNTIASKLRVRSRPIFKPGSRIRIRDSLELVSAGRERQTSALMGPL